MDLAKVTKLKPRIEERYTSKEQQLGHQTSKEQQLGYQTSKEQHWTLGKTKPEWNPSAPGT